MMRPSSMISTVCLVAACSSEPTLGDRVFEAYDAYARYDCGCGVDPDADAPYNSFETCMQTFHAYLGLDVLSRCFDEVERRLPDDVQALRCRYEVAVDYVRCRDALNCMGSASDHDTCQAAADLALAERGCERRDLSVEAIDDGITACRAEVGAETWPHIGVRP